MMTWHQMGHKLLAEYITTQLSDANMRHYAKNIKQVLWLKHIKQAAIPVSFT